MTAQLFAGLPRATDYNGLVLAGGKWTFYATGTTTPQTVYADSGLTTPLANPVVADAGGLFANIYLSATLIYRARLTDALGNVILDIDPYNAGNSSSQVSFLQTAASWARNVQDKLRGFLDVEDFRYDGSGNARSDLVTMQTAIAAWVAQGGGVLRAQPLRNYNLGSFGVGTHEVLPVTGLTNAVFDGQGCTFTVNSTATGALTELFVPRNYINLTFKNYTVNDTGTDLTVNWRGVYAMSPSGDNPAYIQRGLTIDNVRVTNGVAFLFVQGTQSPVEGIYVAPNCVAELVYYGLAFTENGHDVVATLRTINCRRSYFPYGVHNHKVAIHCWHDDVAGGAEAMCLIKRYAGDTNGIDLTLFVENSAGQYEHLVKIEHQPPAATVSTIQDVSVTFMLAPNLNMAMTTAAIAAFNGVTGQKVTPLTLSSYVDGGSPVEETTTTNNVWKHIRVGGNLALAPGNHIWARVKPATFVADIALMPGCGVNPLQLTHKGGLRFITEHGRDYWTQTGDLTAAPFTIDLSRFDNVSLVLGLNMLFMGNTDGTAAQDRTYLEYVLFLTIPAGGPITINASTANLNNSAGVGITLSSITVSGKLLQLNLSGSAYSHAGTFAKVEAVLRGQLAG